MDPDGRSILEAVDVLARTRLLNWLLNAQHENGDQTSSCHSHQRGFSMSIKPVMIMLLW